MTCDAEILAYAEHTKAMGAKLSQIVGCEHASTLVMARTEDGL